MFRLALRTVLPLLLVLSAFALVAFGDGLAFATDTSRPTDVKIDNFTMNPQTITVAAGTEVRWTNADDIPHTVVSEDHTFKSKVLDTDDRFAFRFDNAGTYKYFCSIHPKMTGTIVVK
jgi:plastocyanin